MFAPPVVGGVDQSRNGMAILRMKTNECQLHIKRLRGRTANEIIRDARCAPGMRRLVRGIGRRDCLMPPAHSSPGRTSSRSPVDTGRLDEDVLAEHFGVTPPDDPEGPQLSLRAAPPHPHPRRRTLPLGGANLAYEARRQDHNGRQAPDRQRAAPHPQQLLAPHQYRHHHQGGRPRPPLATGLLVITNNFNVASPSGPAGIEVIVIGGVVRAPTAASSARPRSTSSASSRSIMRSSAPPRSTRTAPCSTTTTGR